MSGRVNIVSTRTVHFNPIRPIYFLHTPDITEEERQIALDTLEEILDIARVRGRLRVVDLGVWRDANYRNAAGQLVPHMSVDWYVDRWFNPQRGQVNASQCMHELTVDPWNEREPHYDVILTAQDLYTERTRFVVGAAVKTRGTITSVARFRGLGDPVESETKKQELFHEVGHVFGLPNEDRGDLEYSLGAHCANACAVRQGIHVPHDWIPFVEDRLTTGKVYCDTCVRDLRSFFGTG